jgi:hypothetical protein
MASPSLSYGASRERAAGVSYAEIETAARKLMADGDYPSVHAVRLELKRGSSTTIADAMRRFWKDQSAMNVGNPVALTRVPPEFADAAVELWERALRLSVQTTQQDDSAARAKLEELKRDNDARARSLELREKEWDIAGRVRERALAETREQLSLLLKQLTLAGMELRARDARIADLQQNIDQYRAQVASLISAAAVRKGAKNDPSSKARVSRPQGAKLDGDRGRRYRGVDARPVTSNGKKKVLARKRPLHRSTKTQERSKRRGRS